MITPMNFMTVAGAAALTTTFVALLKTAWPRAPEPWTTWAMAEATVFVGGVLQGPLTGREALLLFLSGVVVAGHRLKQSKKRPGKVHH